MSDPCIYPNCRDGRGPKDCPYVRSQSAQQEVQREERQLCCPYPAASWAPADLLGPWGRCCLRLECRWYEECRRRCGAPEPPATACKPQCPEHGAGPCGNPNRPGRPQGGDTGRLKDPTPLSPGDLNSPNPPGVWVGPRADLYLPYLFMRANPGDLGARPVVGPFWESPDILLLAGVEPASAPPVPPKLGEIALANQPNTIYAHVWNFGNCAAAEVLVEFYWCDPSLGINPSSTHLIAQTSVALGAKGSGRAHAVVKCPEAWVPTFLNGGHECLLVRIWDNTSDLPGEPKFDASVNRHVAQRNIHVVTSGAPMMLMRDASIHALSPMGFVAPLLLKVGPLYGAPARVQVDRVAPNNVPWLQLHSGERGRFPNPAPPSGTPALSRPTTAGGGFSVNGLGAQQHVTGDDQQVAFTTSDAQPGKGQAHVYRVTAQQGGVVFGGYTIIVVGA